MLVPVLFSQSLPKIFRKWRYSFNLSNICSSELTLTIQLLYASNFKLAYSDSPITQKKQLLENYYLSLYPAYLLS